MTNLTFRELGVLRLVCNGLTNRQISWKLGIKEQTVKNHLWHIYSKLEVKNRTQAAVMVVDKVLRIRYTK